MESFPSQARLECAKLAAKSRMSSLNRLDMSLRKHNNVASCNDL